MNDDLSETEYAALGFVLFAGVVAVKPYVIATLWRWYLVPLGLPALRWVSAFGLNLVVKLLTFKASPGDRTNKESFNASLEQFISPLVALFAGWLALKLWS